MKRTTFPKFKVDAILSSDWHMMEPYHNPPCRSDNHSKAQTNKVKQIKKLQIKYQCPVLNGGDVLQHWKASPELINHCMKIFPKRMWSVAGQHDLPQHNIKLMFKSAFFTLVKAGSIDFLSRQVNWKTYHKKPEYLEIKGKKIAIMHMLVWKNDLPFPDCTSPQVHKVFKMFPDADLIITGDNHQTFTARKGKQLLINPGSLTRHKADQIDHRPCVFLWSSKTNTFKKHYLKINKNVIDRDHIDIAKEKKECGEAFIEKLDVDWVTEVSFEDNIQEALQVNTLDNLTEKYVQKWCGR